MKPLPMPLRLAAGLVATAIEEAQELPRKLVELPVTAVSQVLQASMRMQQRVTELAIKGDQALGGLRPVPETPTWARFDEDETDDPPFGGGGFRGGGFGGGSDHPFGGLDRSYSGGNGVAGAHSDTDWNVPPPRSAPRTVSPIRIARDPEPATFDDFDDEVDEFSDLDFSEARNPSPTPDPQAAAAETPTKPAATKPAATKPAATTKPATTKTPATKTPATKPPTKPAAKPTTKAPAEKPPAKATTTKTKPTKTSKPAAKGTKDTKAAEPEAPPTPEPGPKGHEDYPTWTLAQLRGHFRSLSLQDVRALLTYETGHLDRPPYVTMLSNRIASITGR